MAKTVKVDEEVFKETLRKMLATPPAPKAKMPKSEKKLGRIIEAIKV